MPSNPDADCPLCHGTRWLPGQSENSSVACECQEKRRRAAHLETLYAGCGWPEGIKGATTEGMDLSHPDTVTMIEVAREYARTLTPPFLYLYSDKNGTGKSRIAATIARVSIERERSVFFAYSPEFVQALQRGQFTGEEYKGQDAFDLMEKAEKVDLLILDDFGLYNATPWAELQMDTIIGVRYMHQKATIITSNVALAKTPKRLQSRLRDSEYCQIVVSTAPDYRTLKKR